MKIIKYSLIITLAVSFASCGRGSGSKAEKQSEDTSFNEDRYLDDDADYRSELSKELVLDSLLAPGFVDRWLARDLSIDSLAGWARVHDVFVAMSPDKRIVAFNYINGGGTSPTWANIMLYCCPIKLFEAL